MGDEMASFFSGLRAYIEMMAAAYLKATDIPVEQVELVCETRGGQMIYYFRYRSFPTSEDQRKCD